ncbi:MAG: tRNA epoxyqueuosine(34) reductase QueG, partial [Steroidobacteraceae bacterium]
MSHDAPQSAAGEVDLAQLAGSIRAWGRELGFQQIGIAGVAIQGDEERLMRWLEQGRHGAMDYMA